MALIQGITLVAICFTFVSGQDGNGQCPPGYVSHSESCYKYFPLSSTWPEAVVFCKTFGARLAHVTDQQEQDFIVKYISGLKNSHMTLDIWLGASDLLVNGEWIWTATQQQLGYSNWKPGEPSNDNSAGNCLALMTSDNYMWNDAPCTITMNFLCEIELGTNPIG